MNAIYKMLALAAVATLSTHTYAITLADLTKPGATLENGTLMKAQNFKFTSVTVQPSDVTVEWVGNELHFTGVFSSTGESESDLVAQISYDFIPYTGPNISAVNLYTLGAVADASNAYVHTTINDIFPAPILYQHRADIYSSATDVYTGDSYISDEKLGALNIVNDIHATGTSAVTFIANGFWNTPPSQPPPVIPEPATLTLIPLALTGLAIRKKFAR